MNLSIPEIRIATRESKLALWQAELVATRLRECYPQLTVRLVPMTTRGDQLLDAPLAKIGGKGLFIKELEQALARDEADIAVHSMKDVGVHLPEGYTIAAILPRENPYDAFVSNRFARFTDLPAGAVVGTCSLRRRMQIARGDFDAIILACAGLIRLDLHDRIREILPVALSLPAIGQGAIGIECRLDSPVYPLLAALNDADTALCVQTERIINRHLEGSCQVPLAAFATLHGERIHLEARIGMPDGSDYLAASDDTPRTDAAALGERIAARLIAGGARDILRRLSHV